MSTAPALPPLPGAPGGPALPSVEELLADAVAVALDELDIEYRDVVMIAGVQEDGAAAGTLAFMVGASDEVYAEVLPLLEVMGARIVHCGAAGLGQAAKICNNMVLGVTQIAVAEAFVLGERLGLQHQALYDVMSKASGQCWSLTTNCPVPGPVPGSPANRDFQPGFAGALMAKDLGLALAALDEQGVAADLGRLAQAKYAEYAAGEGAARDFSGIIEDIRASHTDRSEA